MVGEFHNTPKQISCEKLNCLVTEENSSTYPSTHQKTHPTTQTVTKALPILYCRSGIFAAFHTQHDDSEQREETRHAEADTVDCLVTDHQGANFLVRSLIREIEKCSKEIDHWGIFCTEERYLKKFNKVLLVSNKHTKLSQKCNGK